MRQPIYFPSAILVRGSAEGTNGDINCTAVDVNGAAEGVNSSDDNGVITHGLHVIT